jgi:hypothetical protein
VKAEEKVKWYKDPEIILKPLGAVLAALTVALLGLIGSCYLERRQELEMRVRLYTELISRREQAESDLRKDMFTTVIKDFLQGQSTSPETQVLHLELLAYNFHESLNLEPLFAHVKKRIIDDCNSVADRQAYEERLTRVAREITRKQIAILETAGKCFQGTIVFDKLSEDPCQPRFLVVVDTELELDKTTRYFKVTALKEDRNTKEVAIRLEVGSPEGSGEPSPEAEAQFSVGFFDFPMIDNTRLSRDQRCAVVLNAFGKSSADISVIYFPGSHASLREKPYYREMVQQLCPANYKKE